MTGGSIKHVVLSVPPIFSHVMIAWSYLLPLFWHPFVTFFQLKPQSITIGCDGESALNRIFSQKCFPTTNHWDIISGAQSVFSADSSLLFRPIHVHAHQDKNPWNTLDLLTSLNVICNAEAVSYRCSLKHQQYYPQQCAIHSKKWIPVINGERAVHNLRERLCLSLTWPRLHAH